MSLHLHLPQCLFLSLSLQARAKAGLTFSALTTSANPPASPSHPNYTSRWLFPLTWRGCMRSALCSVQRTATHEDTCVSSPDLIWRWRYQVLLTFLSLLFLSISLSLSLSAALHLSTPLPVSLLTRTPSLSPHPSYATSDFYRSLLPFQLLNCPPLYL
jgi:hypothetical protein